MTPEELQELCALYVLGALEPPEADSIAARLQAGDEEVVRAVAAFRDVVQLLPHALAPVAPDPAVRADLLARLQVSRASQAMRSDGRLARLRRPLLWLPIAAALVLAGGLGWWVSELRLQRTQLVQEVTHLQHTVAEQQRLLRLLSTPQAIVVAITRTDYAPNASGHVIWDRHQGELAVLTSGLPALPAGKAYQLWALTANHPVPSDTFRLDSRGVGTVLATLPPRPASIVGIAVSLEPEGGVPQPTGPIVLIGKF
jgi:anti-sigma-K factor RskA